jgi:hypothetical protein
MTVTVLEDPRGTAPVAAFLVFFLPLGAPFFRVGFPGRGGPLRRSPGARCRNGGGRFGNVHGGTFLRDPRTTMRAQAAAKGKRDRCPDGMAVIICAGLSTVCEGALR